MILAVSLLPARAFAQKMHSEMHEEREDRRQEDVVTNMHFADDTLKNKFLEIYVPYQERLFHIDHQFRDLISEYVNAQSGGKPMSGEKARQLLDRGLRLQRETQQNLATYTSRLEHAPPGGVALQAWLIENKLHAATAGAYLSSVPFVQQ